MAVAAASAAPADAAVADELPCPGPWTVVVRAAAADDAWSACDGARRALAFMGGAGLPAPERTTIDIVEQLPGEMRGLAVGCYVRDTRRIVLLSYQSFEALGHWMRVPVERELYRSVAAHEVAHAVVGCMAELRPQPLPVPAHEYLAAVAMFATMEPALRQRVLARFAGPGFDSILQINTIVYLSDPLQFAADAWRHYLKRRDPAGWLRDVAGGQVVQDFPTDGP